MNTDRRKKVIKRIASIKSLTLQRLNEDEFLNPDSMLSHKKRETRNNSLSIIA